MKYIALISRVLLGMIFLVFGINGLYTFIPVPKFHPFMEILVSTGYLSVVKILEIICGVLLLSNRFILVSLIILGPIVINICLYHLYIDPRNYLVSLFVLLLYLVLLFKYWDYFKIITSAKTIKN